MGQQKEYGREDFMEKFSEIKRGAESLFKADVQPEEVADYMEAFAKQEIEKALKEQKAMIVQKFEEIENGKWKDPVHCTCLRYAIHHLRNYFKEYEEDKKLCFEETKLEKRGRDE